jgi:hypothetical protein
MKRLPRPSGLNYQNNNTAHCDINQPMPASIASQSVVPLPSVKPAVATSRLVLPVLLPLQLDLHLGLKALLMLLLALRPTSAG